MQITYSSLNEINPCSDSCVLSVIKLNPLFDFQLKLLAEIGNVFVNEHSNSDLSSDQQKCEQGEL